MKDAVISSSWSKILSWLEDKAPLLQEELATPGNKPAPWSTIEAYLGKALPAEFKTFYTLHNGQNNRAYGGLFFGMRLLTQEEILDTWDEWTGLDMFNEAFEDEMVSVPPGVIKPLYSNPGWIPFTADGFGNHIGIDVDPDDSGRYGQIIIYGHHEHQKKLIANSLAQFLSLFWIQLSRHGQFFNHNNSIDFIDDNVMHYHDRYSLSQRHRTL